MGGVIRVALTAHGARARRWTVAAALAVVVSGILLGGLHLGLGTGLQESASDFLFAGHGTRPAASTVIVGIDQRSHQMLMARHGPLAQWQRILYARAIDALAAAGARVIALGVFFDSARSDDAALSEAIRRARNVVTPVVAQEPQDLHPGPGVAQRFGVFVRPVETVRLAAAAEGLANITVSGDSVVRGLPLLLRAGDEELPALPLTIAALYARRPRVVDRPPEAHTVYAAGRAIPVGEGGILRINFLGPPSRPGGAGPFPIVPLVDVLDGTFDRALVRDRIVLLGPTIRGLDEHPTPTTSNLRMPGVEVLASAVETIVHQRYLVPVDPMVTGGLVVLLALLATGLVVGVGPWAATAVVLLALAAYLTAAALLFESGWILDLVYPPAALLLTFAVTLVHRLVFVEAEERMIRQAMGRYLSPEVGRWMLENPERLALGGEVREMSVLFCDIREFTTLAHALPPEALMALLNRYLGEMTDAVFAHDGVVAQYVGDAIEAFWNAPMDQPDHARRVCQTALDMLAVLERLGPVFAARGWAGLDIGIGINTGSMIVGNAGSRDRLAYMAFGDAVNVASRLEGLTKEYGVHIVIGEETFRAAGDAFAYRFLDRVAVKGRPEPLTVYELLAPASTLPAARLEQLKRYREAVELYHARQWEEAERVLATLEGEAPTDGPIALYRRRSRSAIEAPPPPDWDGVHVMTTK